MEHEITVKDNIFEMKASGTATPKGFIAFLDELAQNEAWIPGSKLLVDLRGLKSFDTKHMDFPGLSSIASFIKKNSDRFVNMKVVTLLTDEMEGKIVTGLWESIQVYYGSEFKHNIFSSYDAAIGWLKSI